MKPTAKLIATLLLSVAALYLTACSEPSSATLPAGITQQSVTPTMPRETAYAEFELLRLANPQIAVLDVRTPGEFIQGHIPGAILVPLPELTAAELEKRIPFAKDQQIYIICRSGNRSLTAVDILRQRGYSGVTSVARGTRAWIANGHAVEHECAVC